MKRPLFLLLLFSASASAQVAVEGEVVLATTGQPLPSVRVLATCPETQLAGTDLAGHFRLLGLHPTGCSLSLDGAGLVPRTAAFPVPPANPLAPMRIAMWPQSLIAGKVVDENGWPVKATLMLSRRPTVD